MLTTEIMKAFAGEMTPKFLATAGADGTPNVVPVISLMAPDPGTLIFGEFMIWKTRRNLEENPKVSALVLTEDLRVWTVRGRFAGFQTTGPHVERLNESRMFRYNAYLGIRRAGVIEVTDVTGHDRLSKAHLMSQVAAVWIAGGRAARRLSKFDACAVMPPPVLEKFSRLQAVRVLAVAGADGWADPFPVMTMRPATSSALIFSPGPFREKLAAAKRGAPAAACVITFDPVAYQVKGTWQGISSHMGIALGALTVTEVYSACPPRPGARIA